MRRRDPRCLIALPVIAALASCGLVDLRPFPITTFPSAAETVLDAADCVWVEFPVSVDHAVVEPLLTVTVNDQPLPGDLSWDVDRLVFTPLSPFAPGARHILRLAGTVRATDGRLFTEDILVPFYVGTDESPPVISSVSPGNGAVVSEAAQLTLDFSVPMDAAQFKDSFSLSPSSDFTVGWNPAGTRATVAPLERWNAETLYTWSLGTAARSQSGVKLGRPWSATFLVQNDSTAPSVLTPGRAQVSGAVVTPLPGGLSDILNGDSIILAFSEDVDTASLATAFSLSPSVAGTIRKLAPASFAFVPAEGWKMGQEYVLSIATDVRDLAGNPLPAAYRRVFTPAVPVQSVAEVDLAGTLTDSPLYTTAELNNRAPYMLNWTVGAPPDNALVLTVVLHFTCPYDDAHRDAIAAAVRLTAYFPSTVLSPHVTQVSWTGPQTLSISYTGFQRSADSPSLARLYYKLAIPSGVEQTGNQEGSYLAEPVFVLLESGSDS